MLGFYPAIFGQPGPDRRTLATSVRFVDTDSSPREKIRLIWRIIATPRVVITSMTTPLTRVGANYASGYLRGRRAAKDREPVTDNPFSPNSSAFGAWTDGHYDEQSARSRAIERHSALIWNTATCAETAANPSVPR